MSIKLLSDKIVKGNVIGCGGCGPRNELHNVQMQRERGEMESKNTVGNK